MVYVFDTSSIRVLGNYYPDRFPTFWQRFDQAVENESGVSVGEVYHELKTQVAKDWLRNWIDRRRAMFLVPKPEETAFVGRIFQVPHLQALVGEIQRLKGQPVADPFVIACARSRNGAVVTEEGNKPNAAKIPNVCEYFEVRWMNLEGFLSENGWRF